MAKFTVSVPLNMIWRGNEIIGAAGETHRIPDSMYESFRRDFVTGKNASGMPGLTWIEDDEVDAAEGGEAQHPDLTTHDTLGLATQAELDAHDHDSDYSGLIHTHAESQVTSLVSDLAGKAATVHTHAQSSITSLTTDLAAKADTSHDHDADYDAAGTASTAISQHEATATHGGEGGGAPTDADYLVGTANGNLSAEIVVGTSPGGELGGTWASPTVDTTHSGSSHADAQAAAEATAASALTTHEGAADPHTGYLKEADFDDVNFLVGTATGLTAAEIVVGTSPGGELGGTWASPTVDATHSGSAHHAQSHAITAADHTASGLTAGQVMQASASNAFGFSALTISRGGTILSAAITAAVNVIVWRAPFACTVTNVRGYRVGGSGATINARRNGSSNHLSSALSLTNADTWMDGGSVQNTAYAAGDKLEIMVVSATGSPTQIAVQVDLTRP